LPTLAETLAATPGEPLAPSGSHYRAFMTRHATPGRQERLLIRKEPAMSLRIWTTLGYRSGSDLPSSATVEWSGRAGHPSSYGLLGGRRSSRPHISVFPSGAKFRDALASSSDDVRWGLPAEYEAAVGLALESQLQTVAVSQAAHGLVGSSVDVFRALTVLLCRLLAGGVPREDAEIWKLRDRCWSDDR
jgi:hypothetical protein